MTRTAFLLILSVSKTYIPPVVIPKILLSTVTRYSTDRGIELVCIDPHQEKVEVSYTLPISEKANPQAGDEIGTITYNRTDIDPTLNWIYFNVKTCKSNTAAGITSVQSVYRMNIGTGEFEHYLDLPGIDMMYGFSVSPQGEVYLCDCLDYSAQRGYIRNYKKDGSIRNFRVGIYPSQVYFP